jgi:hypothetical protein
MKQMTWGAYTRREDREALILETHMVDKASFACWRFIVDDVIHVTRGSLQVFGALWHGQRVHSYVHAYREYAPRGMPAHVLNGRLFSLCDLELYM